MNDKQKAILKETPTFLYYPYEFSEAINRLFVSTNGSQTPEENLAENIELKQLIKRGQKVREETANHIVLTEEAPGQNGTLVFAGHGVESIDIHKDKKIEKVSLAKSDYYGLMMGVIPVEFATTRMRLVLNFRYDLAEPLEIDVTLNRYKEPEIDYQAIYLKKMNVFHGLGEGLMNVYFQLADEKVDRTEVVLYRMQDSMTSVLMAKFKVEDGLFYHSVQGLAFGEYEFQVVQYADGEMLVESPKTRFALRSPNYSGKPLIGGR
jgi:hypothetical protein